jgi:hypothetical protein
VVESIDVPHLREDAPMTADKPLPPDQPFPSHLAAPSFGSAPTGETGDAPACSKCGTPLVYSTLRYWCVFCDERPDAPEYGPRLVLPGQGKSPERMAKDVRVSWLVVALYILTGFAAGFGVAAGWVSP